MDAKTASKTGLVLSRRGPRELRGGAEAPARPQVATKSSAWGKQLLELGVYGSLDILRMWPPPLKAGEGSWP